MASLDCDHGQPHDGDVPMTSDIDIQIKLAEAQAHHWHRQVEALRAKQREQRGDFPERPECDFDERNSGETAMRHRARKRSWPR